MFCDTVETYIETYRNYEVYEVQQVERGTGKPFKDGSGAKWYEMVNRITGDKITTMHHWWRVHDSIDYRLKANPHKLGVA